MKLNVSREQNTIWYRALHWPIWVWVFFILPDHLTSALFAAGPDSRHGIWLAIVALICIWRGGAGRLPGVERRPYITHFGVDSPNLPYRVICYTAAWIDLLVPMFLNLAGLVIASVVGVYYVEELHSWLYYPLALLVVGATLLDRTPRARRSTRSEGSERAWFYVAAWTVVPAQLTAWGAWRLGESLDLANPGLARLRLACTLLVMAVMVWSGVRGRLPRTARYHAPSPAVPSADQQPADQRPADPATA